MKNFNFKITILAMIIFCLWMVNIVGCSETTPPKPKPINDISEHTLFHTGTITNIYYNEDGSKVWFHNVQYNFDDGSVFRMDRIKSDHRPKIGEYGSLYIENGYKDWNHSYIQNGNYLWIKDDIFKLPSTVSLKEISWDIGITSTPKIEKETKKHGWEDATFSTPNVYQLVLIKLDNTIITTGRYNEHNKWQIETDKGRGRFDKYPSFKVIEWKEI